jgi:hypothetical protein
VLLLAEPMTWPTQEASASSHHREVLDAAAFTAAWAEGLAMTFDQAFDQAIVYALGYLENARN